MPQVIYSLILIAVCITGCGTGSPTGASRDTSLKVVTITNSSSEVFSVGVELAVTDEQHQIGLMNRESLSENDGMLFVFDDEQTRSFWMKNTLIPLDMIFINSSGSIVDINHDAVPLSLEPFTSAAPARYVLEVNGGYCDEHSIDIGDQVDIPGNI